jgi:stearoyl-CoA desaturase (delta-9 desaturase)
MFQGDAIPGDRPQLVNVLKQFVFWLVHLACFLVFFTGFSWIAFGVCIFLYFIRMFGITAGFHRYFSHRTYKTSRVFQFIMALIGTMSAQKGPIWWASHHRHHHKHSDTHQDIHSPIISGIFYAHVGWVLSSQFTETRTELVKDLVQYPELRWLERYNLLPPILLAIAMYFLGSFLNYYYPSFGTNGPQMLIWGFFISTVLLYHGTFCINSMAHLIGKKTL